MRTDAPEPAEGVDVTPGLGIGPLRLWVPCRVVWLVDEPTRYGYGLGTLTGHPESGEEAFEVREGPAGRVWFEVRAFSRPTRWYARLAGPFGRLAQDLVINRYVRAMTDP